GGGVTMVGERRNGNLLVQLGPKMQAYPEELIRQRRAQDGHMEYLIRWNVLAVEETGTGSSGSASSSADSKAENILMWMSAEDVYANCPTLLGKRKPEAQRVPEEQATPSGFSADVTLDEMELTEMKMDVRNLVQRARKQMAQGPMTAVHILHTIHVLSAYASIGSLVGVFKETGALDLLMEMLCNEEKQVRRSAGKMLRALASHDAGKGVARERFWGGEGCRFLGGAGEILGGRTIFAGSRAYVLLSLSQQDGIEQHMDFDNRYTLLELFAETTSSEEHCISFEGIHLPQVYCCFLFTLKIYIFRKTEQEEKQDVLPSEMGAEREGEGDEMVGGRSDLKKQTKESLAVLCFLVLCAASLQKKKKKKKSVATSFGDIVVEQQNRIPGFPDAASGYWKGGRADWGRPEEVFGGGVMTRDKGGVRGFDQRRGGDQKRMKKLKYGFKKVSQVYWNSLSRTYWVHWHMVEIIGSGSSGQAEKEAQEKASSLAENIKLNTVTQTFFYKPPGGMYSLPYLTESLNEDSGTLSRAEWWEILFFVKKLEPKQQQEINNIIRQSLDDQVLEMNELTLIEISVPVELAQDLLQYLLEHSPPSSLGDLRSSRVYSYYSPSSMSFNSCLKHVQARQFVITVQGRLHKYISEDGYTLELKDVTEMELEMLLVSLKETNVTKEIVLAIERRLCDETASMQMEMSDVMKDPAIFQALLRSLDQHRGEKVVQQGVLRILNKFLDNYQEDILPWHESIESCLSSMTAFINDREVVQEFVRFLYRLATTNKDYAVVMCRLGTKEALTTALDKHSNLLQVTELRDLVNDCEKNASLYKKMTTSVLAGCIQMVLGQIEEHRRSHQPINIPFFDVFLRNLCQGSSVEIKEDKCWEKVEVSSNHHRASKLTDKNPKTYWESNGSTGSHFINIYIHNGVIIRQLTLLVASEDSSYMPARIVVMGGDSPSNINTELNTTKMRAVFTNLTPRLCRKVSLELVASPNFFFPLVSVQIRRNLQGGIDTRVHGFELLGPKPTFWPVFKEQLCRRTYLFYTTKVHTWCQEILEDRLQLLQLFNKLNSALRHEQMFADRFLPDAEAAEALGRTCWEALINPIVQSVTATDTASPSPMSWLLTEYLENSEISRRSKSRAAIFNSRVRRLTHLLVHVDTSRVETEELKPPTKPEGNKRKEPVSTAAKAKEKTTSSVTGITQCWQEVVQQQVKKFLESSWNSPSFVEYYRNLYLRLKKAMEELFGQQTAFMLALRQGFSAALLQLSFLTAMHVSEQFARYIDQRIQESGMDTSNVGRLNQLQQFLEPILFLSGLELANTFEHFYRFYLGDRLLTQGNAWLESAVIEQVGTCFPNRFPQQMVKNLSESKELQEEFHLYRLQQLDKKLQDMDEEVSPWQVG
uniref:Cullin 7 n=1 Tax=Latimeria chalumnae TaxID=7897 RepID=H3B4Z7_LATCH